MLIKSDILKNRRINLQKSHKNFVWLSLNTGITILSNMASVIILARKMDVSDFGKWSIIFALTSLIVVFRTALGSDLIRKAAIDYDATKSSYGFFLLFALVSTVAIGVLLLLLNLFFLKLTLLPVFLVVLSFLFYTLSVIPVSILTGIEKMEWQLFDSLNALLLLVTFFLLPAKHITLTSVGLVYFLSSFSIFLISLPAGYFIFRPRSIMWSFERFRTAISEVFQLFITNLFIIVHVNLELYLIHTLKDDSKVGEYNVAFKLIIALRQLPLLLMMSYIPLIVQNLQKNNFEYARNLWKKSGTAMLVIAQYIFFVFIVLSGKIIHTLFTQKYNSSVAILILLSFAIMPIFLQSITQSVLFASGNYKKISWAFFIGICIQVILDILFITYFEIVGAGLAFIISEVIIFLLLYQYLHKMFHIPIDRDLAKLVFVNIVLSVIALIITGVTSKLILVLILSFVLYTLALVAMKIIDIYKVKSMMLNFRTISS